MTKEKALYQVKLIIDNLSEEEYNLIPKDIIKDIEDNMEVDESITINPEIPLEEQDIDDKTYDILENMLNRIDPNILADAELEIEEDKNETNRESNTIDYGTEYSNEENSSDVLGQINLGRNYVEEENIKLKQLNEVLQKENSKIGQIKELVIGYKNELAKKNKEVEDLKAKNAELYNSINKCPWIVKKMYFKDFEKKLLSENK